MRKNTLLVLSLSAFGVIALWQGVDAATNWTGPVPGCTTPQSPGCNTDGVIWNQTTAPQSGGYYVNSAKVGSGGLNTVGLTPTLIGDGILPQNLKIQDGELYLKDGRSFHIDSVGNGKSFLNIGNWSTVLGGANTNIGVTIFGDLTLDREVGAAYAFPVLTSPNITATLNLTSPQLCLNGVCRSTWPAIGGGGTVTSIDSGNGLTGGPISGTGSLSVGAGTGISVGVDSVGLDTTYTDGRYVNVSGDTMVGDLTAPNLTATANVSANQHYGNWYNVGNIGVNPYGRLSNNDLWLNSTGGVLHAYADKIDLMAQTWSGRIPFLLDLRSLANINNTVGSVNLGNLDEKAYFYAVNGGSSAASGILYNNSPTTWTGVYATVPNAAGNLGAKFQTADNALQVFLAYPGMSRALDVKGDANFQNNLCLGGVCKNVWPAGTITGATANGGLALNGTTLGLQTSCAAGQILKWTGAAWACAADINQMPQACGLLQFPTSDGAGGWICSSLGSGTGLNRAGTSYSISPFYQLPQVGCSNGQVVTSNGAGGWSCTSAATGDLTGLDIGAGISITDPEGPRPFVAVNFTTLDNRYINNNTSDTMTGSLTINSGNLNVSTGNATVGNTLNISGAATTKMQVNGVEALWFDGSRMSWGYGGTENYFGDWINAPDYNAYGSNAQYKFKTRSGSEEWSLYSNNNNAYLWESAVGDRFTFWRDGDLSIAGDVAWKYGANTWAISSDKRLKKNIEPLSDALDRITKLKGVSFEWKNPEQHGQAGKVGGFIAQDVEAVFPEWVKETDAQGEDKNLIGEDSKMKGIELPMEFNALVVESVKELKAQNAMLQAQNDMLLKRLQALESRIND